MPESEAGKWKVDWSRVFARQGSGGVKGSGWVEAAVAENVIAIQEEKREREWGHFYSDG